MDWIKTIFPSKQDKINALNSKLKRELWCSIFIAENGKGNQMSSSELIANNAVKAYDDKFNQVTINLNS